jgi:hypothetical protein
VNLSDHAKEFSRLAEILRRVQARQAASTAALRDAGPGRYGNATVYRVRRHRVRAHWRAGFVAVRAA